MADIIKWKIASLLLDIFLSEELEDVIINYNNYTSNFYKLVDEFNRNSEKLSKGEKTDYDWSKVIIIFTTTYCIHKQFGSNKELAKKILQKLLDKNYYATDEIDEKQAIIENHYLIKENLLEKKAQKAIEVN